MLNVISVGLGGALGAAGRYGVGMLCKNVAPAAVFPAATLFVNVSGAFLIALASVCFQKTDGMGTALQLFIMTGVMGGFTTFSSFSLETMELAAGGRMTMAAVNVIVSVGACLAGIWLGKCVGEGLF
ncbi:fluoride efflux transporter CrcB [Bacilliculturomica massiliensis]|uniref:fluoride efflux transporter CrcB n=1 Tax=Bacilliculturomica massiliensis TaxID=1917867 RepID=UPI0010314668|nr:fluoride efflux transporter CrcB [Bacilliculturomica massiliensis]